MLNGLVANMIVLIKCIIYKHILRRAYVHEEASSWNGILEEEEKNTGKIELDKEGW